MNNDQFTQLFNRMNRRFDELEAKLETKADGERVYTTLDDIIKHLDHDDAERAALIDNLDRHEQWIGQLADHTATELVPAP